MAGTRTLDGLLSGSFIFSILTKDGSLFNSEYEKYLWSFPGGSDSKQSACNARDLGLIPELVRSPELVRRKWLLTSVFLPGESHEQRSLAGYSPWDCRVGHD